MDKINREHEPARQLAIHVKNGEVEKVYVDGQGIEVLVINEGAPGRPEYLQAHALDESDIPLIDDMPNHLARACMFGGE